MTLLSTLRSSDGISNEHKWSHVNLDDFRTSSCLPVISYIWLWFIIIISIAVFVADIVTAVNLLAFNRFASRVRPSLPFVVSKWIFAICIILSVVIITYECLRAIRIIRKGVVAESYLDPLTVKLQSIRFGRGKGWRRFLVFTKLTKSKKGIDYIALFVYFQFKGALTVLLADGPRQIVNAVTLWSITKSVLLPHFTDETPLSIFFQLFRNIEVITRTYDHIVVIVYVTMLFTLVIWAFNMISLIISFALYAIVRLCYIPKSDKTLSRYLRRKIDARVMMITSAKAMKVLEQEEAKRRKLQAKHAKNGSVQSELLRKPKLPEIADTDSTITPSTSHTAILPIYSSRPSTAKHVELAIGEPNLPLSNSATDPSKEILSSKMSSGNPLKFSAPTNVTSREPTVPLNLPWPQGKNLSSRSAAPSSHFNDQYTPSPPPWARVPQNLPNLINNQRSSSNNSAQQSFRPSEVPNASRPSISSPLLYYYPATSNHATFSQNPFHASASHSQSRPPPPFTRSRENFFHSTNPVIVPPSFPSQPSPLDQSPSAPSSRPGRQVFAQHTHPVNAKPVPSATIPSNRFPASSTVPPPYATSNPPSPFATNGKPPCPPNSVFNPPAFSNSPRYSNFPIPPPP